MGIAAVLGMAASLLLGVAVSQWALKPGAGSLQGGPAGELVAAGALARGLQEQLASVPDSAGTVAVGMTFRDHDGHYCRSFVIEDAQVLAGLACRQPDGRWQVPVVMDSERAATGGLPQAATALNMACWRKPKPGWPAIPGCGEERKAATAAGANAAAGPV